MGIAVHEEKVVLLLLPLEGICPVVSDRAPYVRSPSRRGEGRVGRRIFMAQIGSYGTVGCKCGCQGDAMSVPMVPNGRHRYLGSNRAISRRRKKTICAGVKSHSSM